VSDRSVYVPRWRFGRLDSYSISNMESWISALHPRYSILFAAVFLEAVGLPLPAAWPCSSREARAPVAHCRARTPSRSLLAMVAGDMLMFLMGRYTGCGCLAYCAAFAEPRIVHLAFGGFFLSPRADAARRGQVHSWNQHHGAAARRLHEYAAAAVPWLIWPCGALHRLILGVGFLFSDALEAITEATRRSAGWWLGW